MSIALDQSLGSANGGAGNQSQVQLTTVASAAARSKIFVAIGHFRNTVTGVTDNGPGLAWSLLGEIAQGTNVISVFTADARYGLASGTVITATFSNTDTLAPQICAASFTGVVSGVVADGGVQTNTGTSTIPWNAGTLTTTENDTLIIGAAKGGAGADNTSTPDSGYNELYDFGFGTGDFTTLVYRIASSPGAYTPGGSWSGTVPSWAGVAAAFDASIWSKVQSAHVNGALTGTSPNWTCAYPSNVTAGNLLVVIVGSDTTGMVVSDLSGHNTWIQIKEQADGASDQKTALWYAIAAQSEAITVNLNTAGAFRSIIVQEWARAGGGVIALDQISGTGLNSQTNPVTPSITPALSRALVVGSMGSNNGFATAGGEVDAPFTFEDGCRLTGGADQTETGLASYEELSPASIGSTWHLSASSSVSLMTASFFVPPPERQTSFYSRRRPISRR